MTYSHDLKLPRITIWPSIDLKTVAGGIEGHYFVEKVSFHTSDKLHVSGDVAKICVASLDPARIEIIRQWLF